MLLGLFLACGGQCLPLSEVPITGEGDDEAFAEVIQAALDFERWTGGGRVCISELELVDGLSRDGEDIGGLYNSLSGRIEIVADTTYPYFMAIHELCHALDRAEGLSASRPSLFDGTLSDYSWTLYPTEDKRREEHFAELCERGGQAIAMAAATREACGWEQRGLAEAGFLHERVYPGAPKPETAVLEPSTADLTFLPQSDLQLTEDTLRVLSTGFDESGVVTLTVLELGLVSGALLGWGSREVSAPWWQWVDGEPWVVSIDDADVEVLRWTEAYTLEPVALPRTAAPVQSLQRSDGALWGITDDGRERLVVRLSEDDTAWERVALPSQEVRFMLPSDDGPIVTGGDHIWRWEDGAWVGEPDTRLWSSEPLAGSRSPAGVQDGVALHWWNQSFSNVEWNVAPVWDVGAGPVLGLDCAVMKSGYGPVSWDDTHLAWVEGGQLHWVAW